MLIFSYLLYIFIEHPFIKLLEKFKKPDQDQIYNNGEAPTNNSKQNDQENNYVFNEDGSTEI